VDLTGAEVSGELDMHDAHVAGTLNMARLEVKSDLFMWGPKASFQNVNLAGAKVGGLLRMDGATVTGTLNMTGLEVGEVLLMRSGAFKDMDLAGAKVGGQLSMKGSSVAGTLTMQGLQVGEHLIMRDAMLDKRADLTIASVGHSLNLTGAKLTELDLTATRIEGELRLAPEWRETARLILRNTHTGTLQARMTDAWPKEGSLELDGFTYARLGGPAPDDIDDYIAWLERDSSYTPQPYAHLAAVLRAAGEPPKANRILYESRERERADAWKRDYVRWFGLSLLNYSIGYGLGLGYFLSLLWIFIFTLIGTFGLDVARQGPESVAGKAIFSLGRLLPIVQLDETHKEVDARLAGWVKYYFYAHKLAGWVLASFLIAALAGLTQK
jgi:hypothetical protein